MGKKIIELFLEDAFSQAAVAAVVASFLTWLVSRQGPWSRGRIGWTKIPTASNLIC